MYSTFFGECSSLKKRSYLRQWDFKSDKMVRYMKEQWKEQRI